MWTKDLQHSKDYAVTSNNINGVNIHAAPGIHEATFDLFSGLKLNKSVKICVLGAGAGGFDERLFMAGYCDITAVEFNSEIYKSKGKILERDLNQDFSNIGEFDVVIALEIIEHIENQFDFLRQVKTILKDDGHLILSTPNPKNMVSRIKFMITGDILYFNNSDIETSGHINPVFDHILKFYLKQIHLTIIGEKKLSAWNMSSQNKSLLVKGLLFVACAISIVLKNRDDRAMLIYLIAKSGDR